MNPLRKHLLSLAILSFLAFFSVLVVEGPHHHGNLESKDDCSVCSWQQTGSQAPSAPTPPQLFQALLFAVLFTFSPVYFSTFFISPSGRSPPPIPL